MFLRLLTRRPPAPRPHVPLPPPAPLRVRAWDLYARRLLPPGADRSAFEQGVADLLLPGAGALPPGVATAVNAWAFSARPWEAVAAAGLYLETTR